MSASRSMPRVVLFLFLVLVSLSLFAAGHDLTTSPPTANQTRPVLTGNGSGFIAAWLDSAPQGRTTIVSRRASADGEPIAGAGAAIEQSAVQSIAIAHNPTDTLVVWIADGNVYAEQLSPSGTPLNMIRLTSANGDVSDVAVAWNGSRYFVIWSSPPQLIGAFVAPDGSSTAPHPFFSEPNRPTRDPVLPDLAWDGQHFVVVFGERPNAPCQVTCPIANPDQFRVMRVSAAGDAIDSAPLVITGSHFRAHVASSGTESLIALDSVSEVSTIVAHAESGLTLDPETPLFRWYSEISSAVAWDGAMYTVVWRYVARDTAWTGAAYVTRSNLPFDYRVTSTGPPLPYGSTLYWGRPTIAVNETGLTAFAILEAPPSSFARPRLYLASELAAMPAPPPAPRNAVSYFGGNTARIDWQSDDGAAGFVVEVWSPFENSWYFYGTVPADARTISVYTSIGSLFRIRAFGPGGLSEGTITSIGSMQRRRADRH